MLSRFVSAKSSILRQGSTSTAGAVSLSSRVSLTNANANTNVNTNTNTNANTSTSTSIICTHHNFHTTSTCLQSDSGPDVDIDNYRAEWKTYGDISNYQPGKFVVQTFNKISQKGLQQFDEADYTVGSGSGSGSDDVSGSGLGNPHALLLRSHKLQEEEVPHTVRAIAR